VLPQQVHLSMAERQIPTLTRLLLRILFPRAIPPMLSMAAAPLQAQRNGQATRPPRIPSMTLTKTLRCSLRPHPPQLPRPRWQPAVRRPPRAVTVTRSPEKGNENTGITGLAAQNRNAKIGTAIATADCPTNRRTGLLKPFAPPDHPHGCVDLMNVLMSPC
jgi:hypothetical protein